MINIILVMEGEVIWGAFTKKRDAMAFAIREFPEDEPGSVQIRKCRVYESLAEAPRTRGNSLKAATD